MKTNNNMDMQSRIYAGVTLDVARLTDLYAAIELVEGAAIVHTATDKFGASRKIHRPSPRVLLAEPIRRVNVNDRLAATKADRKHVVAKSDPRAVFARSRWNPDRTVIDVLATLRRMGLTVSQLDAMKTKHGTLEYTVKRSLGLNRRYKRNRQSGRLGRAEVAL